jgi:hypothetical protein
VVTDQKSRGNLTTGIYFNDAITAATTMGGYLATPDRPNEANFIYTNLVAPAANGNLQMYWLGASTAADPLGWNWVTGSPVASWGGATYFDVGGYRVQALVQVPNCNWGIPGEYLQDLPLLGLDTRSGETTNGFVVEYNTHATPEPATMLLLGSGLAGLIGARRNKKPQA